MNNSGKFKLHVYKMLDSEDKKFIEDCLNISDELDNNFVRKSIIIMTYKDLDIIDYYHKL